MQPAPTTPLPGLRSTDVWLIALFAAPCAPVKGSGKKFGGCELVHNRVMHPALSMVVPLS
jgi:hypothetical protein